VASGEVNGGFISTYNITYNPITAALINAIFVNNPTGIFGEINGGAGLALSGTTLYVANNFANTITAYDTGSGTPIGTPPLIYGFTQGTNGDILSGPYGLVISGNNLFVSNDAGSGFIGKYNLTTGAFIDHFIMTPGIRTYGLAISGTNLFVATGSDGGVNIEEFDANSGVELDSSFVSGLQYVYGIAISGTTLYVAQDFTRADGTSVISTYDIPTKTLLSANFIPGSSPGAPELNGGDDFMLVVTAPLRGL
jgi:hypothetical protein